MRGEHRRTRCTPSAFGSGVEARDGAMDSVTSRAANSGRDRVHRRERRACSPIPQRPCLRRRSMGEFHFMKFRRRIRSAGGPSARLLAEESQGFFRKAGRQIRNCVCRPDLSNSASGNHDLRSWRRCARSPALVRSRRGEPEGDRSKQTPGLSGVGSGAACSSSRFRNNTLSSRQAAFGRSERKHADRQRVILPSRSTYALIKM